METGAWSLQFDSTAERVAISVGLVALAFLCALIVRSVVFRMSGKVLRDRLGGSFDDILRRIRYSFLLLVTFLVLTMFAPLLPLDAETGDLVQRFTSVCFIAVLGFSAISIVGAFGDRAIRRNRIDVEDNLNARKRRTRIRILQRTAVGLLAVVTVGAMLLAIPAVREYGVSLFASAGVVGIVVGFAARPVLSNLLAGLQIALTQPMRIEDAVVVEGEWGWIEEITSTYVVVKIWDWRRLIVPLSYFIEKPFQNWTRESASIIGVVTWQLDYTVPIAKVRDKLGELLEGNARWDRNVVNLQVTDSDARSMTVRALMSARNSPTAWDLRCDVREGMIDWLQREYPGALPRLRAEIDGPANEGEKPAAEMQPPGELLSPQRSG